MLSILTGGKRVTNKHRLKSMAERSGIAGGLRREKVHSERCGRLDTKLLIMLIIQRCGLGEGGEILFLYIYFLVIDFMTVRLNF